ncbi:hypothetical protein BGX31_009557 [Mortierella sp. GBA43]|nr:hypothetical protein BGX31_009557 [Mortierella sp. GBA43]
MGLAFLRSRRMRGLIFLFASLVGLYFIFLGTTKHLSSTEHNRVGLNGDGEPIDITQNKGFESQGPPLVALEKRLQKLIDDNRIMVFSKSYCPYSAAAKKLLHSYTNDLQVLEVDLEDHSAEIKAILTKIAGGHSTFPSIFFKGESIGGRDNLQALDDAGRLQPRLKALGVSLLP